MPLLTNQNYRSPFWLSNGHIETIYPALFRKVDLAQKAEQITINTTDDDSFDLDFYDQRSDRTVIISHGLEGNSQRPYMLGMVKKFLNDNWNVIAWNYRGCNGEVNNSVKSYHSGFTDDLKEVLQFASRRETKTIVLVGFSLGGNITLRLLAEGNHYAKMVNAAAVFSVPLELHDGCRQISTPQNIIYSERFLKSMKNKVREKAKVFNEIDTRPLKKIKNLKMFDDHYTAPLHGFKDALDYYKSCSALYVLDQISTPTLIVNAKNDPFLPETCYPYKSVEKHSNVYLETPKAGGHVGFASLNGDGSYWSENRALDFVNSMI